LQKLRGQSADPARFVRLSRGMTLAWGLVLMGFGLVKWGPLLETGLTVASLPFGSLLGLFLLGTFDRGANARGALAGMIVGLAAILCLFPIYERGVYLVFHDWRARHVFRRLACEPNCAAVGAQNAAPQFARTVQFRRTLHEVT